MFDAALTLAPETSAVLSSRLRDETTSPPRPAPSSDDEAGLAKPLLLLVEDDDDVREAGATWLAEQNFEVVTAASGDLAIASIQDRRPDVVVLDLMMPGVNGWDVWDWIQATGKSIPVVIWTATGLRTGAVGDAPVVSKASEPSELLRALRVVFGPRQ